VLKSNGTGTALVYKHSYHLIFCSANRIEPPLAPESLSGLVKLRLSGSGGSVKLLNQILVLCPGLRALAFRKSSLVTYSLLKQVQVLVKVLKSSAG
jgi:hypothetical protein